MKARIGNAIGLYEDLLTSVKRRKLKWYGHVTQSSGLAKTILKEQYKEGGEESDRRNDGKTTSRVDWLWMEYDNDNDEPISRALFHVKHVQYCAEQVQIQK